MAGFLVFFIGTRQTVKSVVLLKSASGIPPAQNPRSSAQGSWTMCIVSVHVVGFCCWMFRGIGGGIVCKLYGKLCQICPKSDENGFENLFKTYLENDSKNVCKQMSWSGLGEVLGALGAPLGTQGGPKSGF